MERIIELFFWVFYGKKIDELDDQNKSKGYKFIVGIIIIALMMITIFAFFYIVDYLR